MIKNWQFHQACLHFSHETKVHLDVFQYTKLTDEVAGARENAGFYILTLLGIFWSHTIHHLNELP